jgi:hypothetical protein
MEKLFERLEMLTSNGYNACQVCEGRVRRSNLALLASYTTLTHTCDMWPSKMRRCRCFGDMEPKFCTNSMKCKIHVLNRYDVIQALDCIAIVALALHY